MAIIRCKRCGNWVSDYSDRCDRCGTPVLKLHTCPGCGIPVSGSNAKCPKCGYRLGASYNPNSLSRNPNVIDHGVYKNDNNSKYLVYTFIALATILIIGFCLFFVINKDSSSNSIGSRGYSTSSGGGLNESVVYFRQNQLTDDGYHSSGNINSKFEKELKKEKERKLKKKMRKQANKRTRRHNKQQKEHKKILEENYNVEIEDFPMGSNVEPK